MIEISSLRIQPEDVLLVTLHGDADDHQVQQIRNQLAVVLSKDTKCLLIRKNHASIEVIKET